MPGRRPKSRHMKLITGNPGKRKLPESEVEPPPGEIVRPAFLTYRQVELWNEWESILTHMGTLTVADVPPFARWCVIMAQFEKEQEKMNDSGKAELRHLEGILGIGASSRAKLGTLGKGKKIDPAEKYFAG